MSAIIVNAKAPATVIDRKTAPPSVNVAGDSYIVIATASGGFAGMEGMIARYNGASWDFLNCAIGSVVWSQADSEDFTCNAALTWTAGAGSSLPLAGGTMNHNACITFAPTNTDSDGQISHLKILPAADGAFQSAPFQLSQLRALFGTTYDHSAKLGWNIPGTPEHDETQASGVILWEHNYDSTGGAGVIWDEMHWSMYAPGGPEVRVFSSTIDWVSGVVSAGHYCDSIYVSLRDGTYLSLTDSTGLALYKSRNLYMYDSAPTKKSVLAFSGTELNLSESTTQLNIKSSATYTDGSLYVGDASADPHEFKVIGASGQYFRAYVSAGTTQVISAQTMLFSANAGGAYELQLYNGGVVLVGDVNLSNGTQTAVVKVSPNAASGGADSDVWVRTATTNSSIAQNINGTWRKLVNEASATIVGGFGCNGQAAQTAYASGGALAAYGAGANGFDTAGNASALYAMVVAIRAALVANGIMS